MKMLFLALFLVLRSTSLEYDFVKENYIFNHSSVDNNRLQELDQYWASLAKAAKEGDFDGMKATYHPDAVVVKPDTTFAVSEAFKVRWKKEILEVRDGKRANTLEFRFSKRIGDDQTAFEKGIYHYTSIETSTGKTLGDSYVHFETLLVKANGQWVALMEYQQEKATKEEWIELKASK